MLSAGPLHFGHGMVRQQFSRINDESLRDNLA